MQTKIGETEDTKKRELSDEFDIYDLMTQTHNTNSMLSRNIPLATLSDKAKTYIIKQTVLVKLMHDFIAKHSKEEANKLVETFMTHIEAIALVERNQKTNVALIGFLKKGSDKPLEQEISEPKGGILKPIKNLLGKKRKEEEG